MADAGTWLVVMALPAEEQEVFRLAGIPVLFTGVGKGNAAMTLARTLAGRQRSATALAGVVNFGTAGSQRFAAGSLVACTEFHQRDMDVSQLGFAHGVTPYDETATTIQFPSPFAALPIASCGTGDSFDTGVHAQRFDVVDMEAYALAKVCMTAGVTFAAAKYISDGADGGAATDWRANLHRAADRFLELYRQLHINRP